MGVNFWGVVHGTQAFLPHLRASGEGHVVNVSSVFGLIAVPTQGAYNATKFAVRAWTEALRMELEAEGAPVSATVVHPGGIRTNIARSARVDPRSAHLTGDVDPGAAFERVARTTPERAARVICDAIIADRRRVLIGLDARLIDLASRLPTGISHRIMVAGLRRRRR